MVEFAVVGKSLPRSDALEKVRGAAQFTADLKFAGMLYGKILRSPHPHARILHIDTSRAARLPGVKAIVTGDDVPRRALLAGSANEVPLALGRVRHVGEGVAAVAATSEEIAAEALELIRVAYEPLPAFFDPVAAMEPGAPLLHEAERNIASHYTIERGNIGEGWKQAVVVAEGRFYTSSVSTAPLETNVCIASCDASGHVTLHSSLRSLFRARPVLARDLNLSESDIRLIQPYIGGAFGNKGPEPTPMYAVAALLAKQAGRPVKIECTREEEFATSRPAMTCTIEMKMGANREGLVVAKETRIIADQGAYRTNAPQTLATAGVRPDSMYRYQNIKTEAFLVYTNKQPVGSYRGLGNPQGTFPIEILLDMLAEELGMDPLELRLRNASQRGDVSAHGWVLGSCGLSACLARAAEGVQWQEKRKAPAPYRGLGMGCVIHVSGRRSKGAYDGSSAIVKLNEDGKVNLLSAEGDVGQGSLTALPQICAEILGVPLEDVRMASPDSDLVPYGLGPSADRITHVGGNAVKVAALDARQQLFALAAERLEANPEDLEAHDGKIFVRGSPERALTLRETVRYGLNRRGGLIIGRGTWNSPAEGDDPQSLYGNQSSAYAFAAQAAEVEVDPETGLVRVLKMAAAHDLGRAINPRLAEGQIEGGLAQGIGHALTEELVWKEGRVLNPHFLDYRIPTALDMPPVQSLLVESDDPNGPFGAKGLGETTLVPTMPAIANAIAAAIGVRLTELPFTPEKILAALRSKR